jgi:DNA-binding IclR family transcriptional regulator
MKTAFSIANGHPPTPEVVKSADRLLDLLELLGCAIRPLGLAEVTAELGIPKSSALALLRTLVARGYVARDAAEGYALAHPFGLEEGDWLGGLPRRVAALGRPVVEALVARTGETVNLGAMLSGFRVRPLIQQASPLAVRYDPRGVDCPAYCTAMGRMLLAHLPDASVDLCLALPIRPVTPATRTDPAAIRAQIALARRQGFAEIADEFVEGAAGVAAAVFDRDGRAVATINLATLTWRWQRHRLTYITAVQAAAAALSRKLGGPGAGEAT